MALKAFPHLARGVHVVCFRKWRDYALTAGRHRRLLQRSTIRHQLRRAACVWVYVDSASDATTIVWTLLVVTLYISPVPTCFAGT